MTQKIISYYRSLPIIIILGFIFISIAVLAEQEPTANSSWQNPTANPPGNNVPAPLNVSRNPQFKVGGLILNTGGAENGLLVDNGNVGIGTRNPSSKLYIKNTDPYHDHDILTIEDSAGKKANLRIWGVSNGKFLEIEGPETGQAGSPKMVVISDNLTIKNNLSTAKLYIKSTNESNDPNILTIEDSSGKKANLGIWGISPSRFLEIEGPETGGQPEYNKMVTISDNLAIKNNLSTTGLSAGGTVQFSGLSQQNNYLRVLVSDNTGKVGWINKSDIGGGSNYWTLNGSNLYSNDPKWAVGIGTTTPRRKLDVAGEIVALNRLTLAQDTGTDSLTWHVHLYKEKEQGEDKIKFMISQKPNINYKDLTPRLTIHPDTGNVGIGTKYPSKKLDVFTTGSQDDGFKISRSDSTIRTGLSINMGNINPWIDYVGGIDFIPTTYDKLGTWIPNKTVALSINANGNIGIGLSDPSARLHILGDTDYILTLQRQDATYPTYFRVGKDGAFVINNNNNDILTIKNNNVGIGTQSPVAKLHIYDNTTQAALRITGVGDNNNTYSAIYLDDINKKQGEPDKINTWYIANKKMQGTQTEGDLHIGRWIDPSDVKLYMVIDSSTGKIGIGEENPSKKLDVFTTGSESKDDGFRIRRIYNDNNNNISTGLSINMGDTNPWIDYVGGIDFIPTIYGKLGTWVKGTNPAKIALHLDNNGNVGIGLSNPSEKLEVNGNLSVIGNILKTGTVSLVENHPFDPNKQIVYVSLEGGEAGTYVRGEAKLSNGEAEITLPEHFALVTEKEGVTAQLTCIDECKGLRVIEVSNSILKVKELNNGQSNARFYYLVNGVRNGYKNFNPIQNKK